jgi:hypothetical protein
MRDRCTNSNASRWEDYGQRGISVCPRWLESFENFFEDMGPRPEGKTLDRINGDGNYEPENCRWATDEEQANNKSNTRWLEYDGERLPIRLWAKKLGLKMSTLKNRIYSHKWPVERALSAPYLGMGGLRARRTV